MGRLVDKETKKIIEMHEKKGLSCSGIAEKLGKKRNTVLQLLRYHKRLRKNMGFEIEKQVFEWLKRKSHNVESQPGDSYWDITADGVKLDVKSARVSKNGRYYFAINHKQTKNHIKPDYFLFVFKDVKNKPMYLLSSDQVDVKSNLNVPKDPFDSRKYKFEFLGYLNVA